jgi:hypothetical protein
MAIRSLRFRPSLTVFQPTIPCIRHFHHRYFAAQSTASPEPEVKAELAAQAELAAKAKVLSPYHKVSFDERKVRIPWQDGKTSALYVALNTLVNSPMSGGWGM